MRRVIKFRAWNPHKREMFEPDNPMDLDGDVMQSTGLKDKDGTEIFEGDIVQLRDDLVQEITFHYGMFAPHYSTIDLAWHVKKNGLKVIGNMYSNPELLADEPVAEGK